jgi:inward rectifier potassium channel
MAIFKKFNQLKAEVNSGFGENSSDSGGRFYERKKHKANVVKSGIGFFKKTSWYHTLLEMRVGKFLLLLFAIYISINICFAGLYYLIGVEHLSGVEKNTRGWKNFIDVFFFSTQTFTTVGYGRISPVGFAASAVSTFEAFIGLLSFAIATGLFYGRFSRPQAFLKFSSNALISPYKNATALMFRMAPYKNNNLSEAEVKLTIAMQIDQNGKMNNRFYNLDVEISKINSLALSWTIVHPINEKSPLRGFTEEDLKNTKMELLVFVKAFDEVFSNTVITRFSYITSEMVWGAKFRMMYNPSPDKKKTNLDLSKLNTYDPVKLPEPE